jgi:hypothetical protein
MARPEDEYTDEPPPPRRRRDDDEYTDEPRPSRRRRDDDDDYDDRPRMSRADVRAVAWAQKAIILCILANLATLPLRFALSTLDPGLQLLGVIVLAVYYLAVAITATVFVFMLAVKVYGTGMGVVLGILTLIPCVGLIVLLIINSKATGILRKNGVRVGLLGAKMADLP